MAPIKVLVVEDESVVALDIQHRLQAMGYVVAGLAFTGPEAVQLGNALRPDIALMDIRLKGPMSGIETAEELRAHFDLPIIYLTAYADQATLERARVSAPYGYVLKPFEDRELNITIEIALYRHQIETKLRQNEMELRVAHDELERRVLDRTAELTRVNEQLRQEIVARELAQAQRAAAQEERRRLAQEIHDSVTQSIFSLIFTTQAARKAEQRTGQSLEQTLGEVEDIARQALKDLRLLLYQLRSPLLDHTGLIEALRYRLDAVENRAGLKTKLESPAILEMSHATEESAYRVAMEALNNSLKHAKATEVTVEIRTEEDTIVLTVTDNGIGFDEATLAHSAGLGLAGMQERAARLGGQVIVRSTRDQGTSIILRLHRFAQDAEDAGSEGNGMSETIRVLVVDDHRLVRKGLISLLSALPGIEIVGEAENGERALERAAELRPAVVLLDLSMPVMDGLATIPAMKKLPTPPSILVLTSFSEDERVFAAIRAGALGYVLKDATPEELVDAIKTVWKGQPSLSPDVAQKLVRQVHRANTPAPGLEEPLTDREIEVLRQVAAGLSNGEIAEKLVISERTVGAHISRILFKLGLSNRTQARALRNAGRAGRAAHSLEVTGQPIKYT